MVYHNPQRRLGHGICSMQSVRGGLQYGIEHKPGPVSSGLRLRRSGVALGRAGRGNRVTWRDGGRAAASRSDNLYAVLQPGGADRPEGNPTAVAGARLCLSHDCSQCTSVHVVDTAECASFEYVPAAGHPIQIDNA